ncbi:uncharacterized protein LOC123541137 [Mercenaria mercenaria]|uniref:uncharacterized protein LOC123541137 n=1 Tax=Mercenaria mercenaria TaxID=6596 RepID=UPI00234E922E|nr:uncharacterized protein LOC123541137 [Mercenaria mercenaria]
MIKLLAFVFLGTIAIVLSNRCHVTNDENEILCGNANNMTCNDVAYIPYCHQTSTDPKVQLNGVCSCEHFCFADSECSKGCSWSSRYVGVCQEVYTNSIQKVCLCKRRH